MCTIEIWFGQTLDLRAARQLHEKKGAVQLELEAVATHDASLV